MDTEVAGKVLPRLLELQTEDTALLRLTERRASLPEAQRLRELTDQIQELDADIQIATKQHDEIGRETSRLEGEVELLETKIVREEQRLFSGGVSNPKELASLQAEVAMLKNKKSTLEDGLLEVMEQREIAAGTLSSLESERSEAVTEARALTGTVTELLAAIDAQTESHTVARTAILDDIPADLLELYEKLRATKHGVGVAPLVGATCQGCHTALPAKELERMRSEGGLQRCDNCRRILVIP
ncbi:MAG TPA: C4-type zinc ribbon domain-containing protein [Actinomycetota bacterium]|nr:C4-type zinc ribbon domain-containing protein [Actinomycetota bacterium]